MVPEPATPLDSMGKKIMRRIMFTVLVILGFCANASGPKWATEANPGLSGGYQSPGGEKINPPITQVANVAYTKPPFNGIVRGHIRSSKPTQRNDENRFNYRGRRFAAGHNLVCVKKCNRQEEL